MILKAISLERRLQIAGIILILGLLVQGLCLLSHGAVGFLIFTGLGGSLLLLGIVIYLLALVGRPHQRTNLERKGDEAV